MDFFFSNLFIEVLKQTQFIYIAVGMTFALALWMPLSSYIKSKLPSDNNWDFFAIGYFIIILLAVITLFATSHPSKLDDIQTPETTTCFSNVATAGNSSIFFGVSMLLLLTISTPFVLDIEDSRKESIIVIMVLTAILSAAAFIDYIFNVRCNYNNSTPLIGGTPGFIALIALVFFCVINLMGGRFISAIFAFFSVLLWNHISSHSLTPSAESLLSAAAIGISLSLVTLLLAFDRRDSAKKEWFAVEQFMSQFNNPIMAIRQGKVPARKPYLPSRKRFFAYRVKHGLIPGLESLLFYRLSSITDCHMESAVVAIRTGMKLGYRAEDIAAYLARNYPGVYELVEKNYKL